MSGQRILALIRIVAAMCAVAIIVSSYLFGSPHNRQHETGWAILLLALVFFLNGISRFRENRQMSFVYMGVAILMTVFVVAGFGFLSKSS